MNLEFRVDVEDDAIRVSKSGTPLTVTFRRNCGSGILEAQDFLGSPWASGEEIDFIASAWRLAYTEARALGWLRAMHINRL